MGPRTGHRVAGRGSPRIVADIAAEAPSRTRRVFFADQEFGSPPELARAFQQHWTDGIRQLYQVRDATLVDELERLLRSHHLDEALRLVPPGSHANELPRRYASLLAEMDPELEPVYNGVRLTHAGLEAAAVEVVSSGGDHPAAKIMDEVRRLDILISWRDLPGMQHGPGIQQRWAAANRELAAEVEVLGRHGYQPTTADWDYARAWLLLCILEPSHHGRELGSLITDLDSGSAERQQWWRDLRHRPQPTPASLVLTHLTHSLATEQTHRQEEAERGRRRAEEQRQADAAAEQRRQRQAEQDRRAARRRHVDKQLAGWAIALIVTFGAPYGLGVWWSKHLSHPLVQPPPDIRALPTGTTFLPEWAFGALVILGLLGLILLRPPWTGRAASVFGGVLLVAAGVAAPWAANTALTDFNRAGQNHYVTGPIPVSAVNGTCDSYWTSDAPVGTGYMRWVLTNDDDNGGCAALAAYHGWREAWQLQLGGSSWWQNLHMYQSTIVAEKDTQNEPNVLDGINSSNGRLLWTFSCQDGDASYLSDTAYGATDVTVTCARGQVNVDPQTGRQIS